MSAPIGLFLRNAICSTQMSGGFNTFLRPLVPALNLTPYRNAARKGTREKARKKKVKVEIQKVGFIPHNQRESAKNKILLQPKKQDDRLKSDPVDDVWAARYYKWRLYSIEEAIECHRETHHPQIYNQPDAPINAIIDLDLRTQKQGRFLEAFRGLIPLPHGFNHGEVRTILAFSKNVESQKEALLNGAQVAGGLDLIKNIETGEISLQEFQFVVADIDIIQDMVPLRGLLKRKFPTPKTGTLGPDIAKLTKNFKNGVNYTVNIQTIEPDFGWIEQQFGTLDMPTEQLKENLQAILLEVGKHKPQKIEHDFIWRVSFTSKPSVERLKVDHLPLLQITNKKDTDKSKDKPVEDEDIKQSVSQ